MWNIMLIILYMYCVLTSTYTHTHMHTHARTHTHTHTHSLTLTHVHILVHLVICIGSNISPLSPLRRHVWKRLTNTCLLISFLSRWRNCWSWASMRTSRTVWPRTTTREECTTFSTSRSTSDESVWAGTKYKVESTNLLYLSTLIQNQLAFVLLTSMCSVYCALLSIS